MSDTVNIFDGKGSFVHVDIAHPERGYISVPFATAERQAAERNQLVAIVRKAAAIKPGRSGLALHALGMEAADTLRALGLEVSA